MDEGTWYAEAVRWATSEGLAAGYGNGKFGPNDPITREQMATMIYSYEKKYGDGGLTGEWMFRLPFTDLAKVDEWAYEGVAWCYKDKVMSGKEGNLFDPDGKATRAELATVLTRYRLKDLEPETEE